MGVFLLFETDSFFEQQHPIKGGLLREEMTTVRLLTDTPYPRCHIGQHAPPVAHPFIHKEPDKDGTTPLSLHNAFVLDPC